MNFSYQMIAVQGALVGAALVLLYALMGAPILKLMQRQIKQEIKLIRRREKALDKKEAKAEVTEETDNDPAPLPVQATQVTAPSPTVSNPDGIDEKPIYYEGKWYANACVASNYLNKPIETIRANGSLQLNDKGLWDENGHFDVAVRHRIAKIGRSRKKLVVSDYRLPASSEKIVSRGFIVHDRVRSKIDVEDQVTGPETMNFFKDAAQAALLAKSG
jgi:hypothetical protein